MRMWAQQGYADSFKLDHLFKNIWIHACNKDGLVWERPSKPPGSIMIQWN